MDVVRTHHLTKRYGRRTVVDDLNLRIPAGSVYGFLGPNGSGKSTTMKMLLALVRPTEGDVEIFGRQMTRDTRRQLLGGIGSLIEAPPGYGHLTGAENMMIVQRSLRLERAQVERAVATVRMTEQMDKRVREYSLGMKQRLGIAMALAREPHLLVLDEPTNGLDPAGIEEIRGLLRYLADQGITVMISSHLLEEIDKVADHLGILSAGRVIFQGTRDQLFAASAPDLLIDTSQPERAGAVLRDKISVQLDSTGQTEGGTLRLPGVDTPTTERIVEDLVCAGAAVHGVRRDEQSLEHVFMKLTSGGQL